MDTNGASINKMTLSEQIYMVLRDDIIEQHLKCGQKLTLNDLKARFQVSSTPIRDALMHLVDDGLVSYYSNIGVTVATLSADDVREIFEFVGDLDSRAVAYCARTGQMDKFLLEFRSNMEQSRTCMERGDIEGWRACSDTFHWIFHCYAGNSRMAAAAKKMHGQTSLIGTYYETGENMEQIQEGHEQIYRAIFEGNFEEAGRRMHTHLEKSMRFALAAFPKEN